jgi:hypothetical protein
MSKRLEIYNAFSGSNVININTNKFLTLKELMDFVSTYFKAPVELKLNADDLELNKELTLIKPCNCYNCSGRKFFQPEIFFKEEDFLENNFLGDFFDENEPWKIFIIFNEKVPFVILLPKKKKGLV